MEIGNCASSQIQEVHVSCYPLQIITYVMRYCHQPVGVISQSFINLWCLLHPGYKRHKHTRSYTPLDVLYFDINPEDFTQSLKYIPREKS